MRPGTMLSVTVRRAEGLQCMERNGPFRPFAKAWVDKNIQRETGVDEDGDRNPVWNTTLGIPLARPIDDYTTLKIDIFDARNDGNTKYIGSAKLKLMEVVNNVVSRERTLTLRRRSRRSRGHVVVEVLIGENPAGTDKRGKRRRRDRVKSAAKGLLRVVGVGAAVASSVLGVVGTVGA